ncbi:MAG: tetratricopeptide repeat protein [Thermoplasmata archaeon]
MIGRETELGILEKALQGASEGQGRSILISGDAGIGKTTLVQEFVRRAEGVRILSGAAMSGSAQPFQVFSKAMGGVMTRPLFEEHEYKTFTELFAIDRAGLLVAQASPQNEGLDADIFAGMFSAVQDFVRDSFDRGGGEGGSLGRLEYGDMKILIEHGKHLFLVAVFKGVEHADMRGAVRNALRDMESRHGHALESWSGNVRDIAGVKNDIDSLARTRFLVRKSLEGVSLEQERIRISDEMLDQLGELSAEKPVILLLEDLHWADESSIFVLRYLARNIGRMKIMALGTMRAAEGAWVRESLGGGTAGDDILHLELGCLDSGGVAAIVGRVCPNHSLPEDFLRMVEAQSNGNPFFVTEMLRHLLATGNIASDGGTYRLMTDAYSLPATIEEVVHHRIGNLKQDELALVEFASCFGMEFDRGTLLSITGVRQPGQVLDGLLGEGILVERGEKMGFGHAMFQSVVYGTMPDRWKRHFHRTIGEFLEEKYRDRPDEAIYELAWHFSKTAEHRKVLVYCMLAAEKAEGAFSVDLAVEHYKNAQGAVRHLKSGKDAASREFMILERLGEIQGLRGNFPDSSESFARAVNLSPDGESSARIHRKLANILTMQGKFDEALAELVTAESFLEGKEHDEMGFLLVARSFINVNKGEFDATAEQAGKGIAILENNPGTDAQRAAGKAWKIIGVTHMLRGRFNEALECYGRGLDIGEKLGDLYGISASLNNIGNVYLAQGKFDLALEQYMRTLEILSKTKDLQGKAYVLNNMGIIYKNRGDYNAAMKSYQECLWIVKKIGEIPGIASSLNNIGNLFSEQEMYAESMEPYDKGLAISRQLGDKQMIINMLCAMAISNIALGNQDIAEEQIRESLAISQEIGAKKNIFWTIRNRGLLHAARGEHEQAVACLAEAAEGLRGIDMEPEVAKTQMEHAKILLSAGDIERGTDILRKAEDIFRSHGMEQLLKNCQKMRERHGC